MVDEEQQAAAPAAPAAAPAKGKGMWIGIVVVVIVIVILLAAVFGGLFGAPQGPPPGVVLKIGTVLSLTGTSGLEAFGPKNQRGALLAVEEINAAGGVLGNAIQVVNEDDQGVDATSRDRAQKLATTDQVDAIIGAVGSGKCAAVLEVTKAEEIVQVSASCTSPIFSNLTFTDGWFFRTAPSDALQGVVAANYAYTNQSLRWMGVIGNDNPYGRGLANVFKTEFESLGGSANLSIFAEGRTSYSSELQALIGNPSNPPVVETVYMANYPTDGLRVMQDWFAQSAWANVDWLFSEGVLDQGAFVDPLYTAGINASHFQGSAPGAYLGIVGALYDGFETRYKARYSNQDPGLFTANAYDAVYLLAAAAQKAGVADGSEIKAQMRSVATPGGTPFSGGQWAQIRAAIANGTDINYEGASGAVDIDTLGDPLSGYAIWGVDPVSEQIETLEFFDEATVIALLGAPPLPAPGTRSTSTSVRVEWIAAGRLR